MSKREGLAQLRATQKSLFDNVIQRYENGEAWRLALNLGFVVGGGVLVALAKLPALSNAAASWLNGIGIVMVFVGGVLVALFDRKRTKLTNSARDAVDLAQQFIDERDSIESQLEQGEDLDRRRVALLEGIDAMREVIEASLDESATSIAQVTQLALQQAALALTRSINFERGELWVISIFEVQAEELVRVAAVREDGHAERPTPRTWRRQEGFVGEAWHNSREVIVEDSMSEPERYYVPPAKRRENDSTNYRSMAVVPVEVGEMFWGVVAVSSSKERRFLRGPTTHNIVTVQQLAGMTALLVRAFSARDTR